MDFDGLGINSGGAYQRRLGDIASMCAEKGYLA
jgi:hypothetical protein